LEALRPQYKGFSLDEVFLRKPHDLISQTSSNSARISQFATLGWMQVLGAGNLRIGSASGVWYR
jgi:hypothetical protein